MRERQAEQIVPYILVTENLYSPYKGSNKK